MCFQISVICSLLVKVNNSSYFQLLLTCVHQLLANVIPTHHGQWTDSVQKAENWPKTPIVENIKLTYICQLHYTYLCLLSCFYAKISLFKPSLGCMYQNFVALTVLSALKEALCVCVSAVVFFFVVVNTQVSHSRVQLKEGEGEGSMVHVHLLLCLPS